MELHFSRTNGPVDETIDRLLEQCGPLHHPDLVREMILAALKSGTEDSQRANLRLMNSTLKEMRFTGKVFGPYRDVRKVTVFGSARTRADHPLYRMAVEVGRDLAAAGYMVITGAGPGIMHAANEGAGADRSFGVNIRLPFEQRPNPVIEGNPRLITYKYFFNRKVAFLREAHAVILFPGGFGTMDEAMETLTLIQTGKQPPFPLVLVDAPEGTYWDGFIAFLREQLGARGYIGASDFSLFCLVRSAAAAVAEVDRFYRRYHSLRYVRGQLVLRLTRELPEGALRELREGFAGLLTPDGSMRLGGALPDEDDEPDLAELPRLIVDFNRSDFGTLRQLIDRLNAF